MYYGKIREHRIIIKIISEYLGRLGAVNEVEEQKIQKSKEELLSNLDDNLKRKIVVGKIFDILEQQNLMLKQIAEADTERFLAINRELDEIKALI